MLVSAKLTYPMVEKDKAFFYLKNTTCPTITCRYCRILDKSETITSSFLQQSWRKWVGCCTSCLTDNVVYLIICLKGKSQYNAETKRKLRQRMYKHIQSMESYGPGKQATPVLKHFNKHYQRPDKFISHILETIKGDPPLDDTSKLRHKHEKWWILNLRTLDPFGMNATV